MTWKKCAGCTRALPVAAFTCEYCGRVCDDVMDFLPTEGKDQSGVTPSDQGTLDYGVDALPPIDTTKLWADGPAPVSARDAAGVDAEPVPSFESWAEAADELPLRAPAIAAAVTPTPIATASEEPQIRPARIGPRQITIAGAGVAAAAALIFTILGMRGAASLETTTPVAVTRPAPAKNPARAKAAAPAARTARPAPDAPEWSRVTDGRWVGTRRNSAAFEVSAIEPVHVWLRDVTPLLVVRCEAGSAEAFVFTESAARMEPQDGDHTVRIAFDDAKPAIERWPDSAEHDALFARDHQAFTRQLTESRTLRFGFTPHNAEPVVATFAVDGLRELLASAGRQCSARRDVPFTASSVKRGRRPL